ncbi:MAG: acyl carrier protein [Planctomycetia bacterium]|nr:acyl carrier protein [Planctomycetia bacterium]
MQISDSILQDVRRLVADKFAFELDEVQSESGFFADLGLESIDLLELSFHLEKLYGVKIRLQDMGRGEYALDEQGCLTGESLVQLKSKYPFMKLDGFETRPLRRPGDIVTIDAIAGFVQMALEANGSQSRTR